MTRCDLVRFATCAPPGASLIGDGAYGTALQDAGLEAGECGELWNLEAPEKVEAIHRGYAEAGLHVPHHEHLRRHGTAAGDARARRPGGRDQPRRSRDRPARWPTTIPGVLVAGNIGPSGELIAPLGLLSS